MKYFNESAEYFGDKLKPLVSDNRLTVKSVKIFADGIPYSFLGLSSLLTPHRRP
jgi:hypothetical protein